MLQSFVLAGVLGFVAAEAGVAKAWRRMKVAELRLGGHVNISEGNRARHVMQPSMVGSRLAAYTLLFLGYFWAISGLSPQQKMFGNAAALCRL